MPPLLRRARDVHTLECPYASPRLELTVVDSSPTDRYEQVIPSQMTVPFVNLAVWVIQVAYWDLGLASTSNLISNYAARPQYLSRCNNCLLAGQVLDRQPGEIWFNGIVLPLTNPGFTPPADQGLNVQYLCKVKQLKQPANLVQSVLVAVISLFVRRTTGRADSRPDTGRSTARSGCSGAPTLARSATSACSTASPTRPRPAAHLGTAPSNLAPRALARIRQAPPQCIPNRRVTLPRRRCRGRVGQREWGSRLRVALAVLKPIPSSIVNEGLETRDLQHASS